MIYFGGNEDIFSFDLSTWNPFMENFTYGRLVGVQVGGVKVAIAGFQSPSNSRLNIIRCWLIDKYFKYNIFFSKLKNEFIYYLPGA